MIEIVINLLSSLLIGVCIGQMYVLYRAVARTGEDIARLKEPHQTQGEYHVPLPRRRRRRC